MATGTRKPETLADWRDDQFTTAPPEDVRMATEADIAALYEARPEDIVEAADYGFEVRAAASRFGYVDESSKLYVGKEFTLEQFADWWSVQRFGSLPYNGCGIHHTAIPDRWTWIGLQHLHNTYNYYDTQLNWPTGVGPQIFLRSKRAGKVGGPKVYVGTHPAHDGIGISYRNRRYVHIEFIDRFDSYGMDQDDINAYAFVLKLVCGTRGIPYKHTAGAGWDNPAKPMDGWLFHRRSLTNPKTCPGSKVYEGDFATRVNAALKGSTPTPPKPGPKPPSGVVLVRLKSALPAGKAIHQLPLAEAKKEQERLSKNHGIETVVVDGGKIPAR